MLGGFISLCFALTEAGEGPEVFIATEDPLALRRIFLKLVRNFVIFALD